jgi:hypothetical protein
VLKLARFIVPLPKDDEVEEANQVREITFHVVTNGNKLNEGISD